MYCQNTEITQQRIKYLEENYPRIREVVGFLQFLHHGMARSG